VTDLRVRRYEPRDADVVWDLHERALRDVGAFDEEYAHLDADLRRVPEAYLDAGGEFLVGDRVPDGSVVAMGGLQPATAVDHHEHEDALMPASSVGCASTPPTSARGTPARS